MKVCPNCKTENKFDGAQFCKNCGASLAADDSDLPASEPSIQDDGLDFTVAETTESSAPQLLGGITKKDEKAASDEEYLEIKDNANLLEDEAYNIPIEPSNTTPNEEMAKPPEPAEPPPKQEKPEPIKVDWGMSANAQKEGGSATNGSRLNYPGGGPDYPSKEDEKTPVKDKPDDDFAKTRKELEQKESLKPEPIPVGIPKNIKPDSASPQIRKSSVKKSSRVRGLAYYHKNIIQIVGSPFFHENDEILYNNKAYVLKPYRISKKAKLIGMAAAFVILLFIVGSQFIGPTVSGDGQIIGVILDENDQPYLGGATVAIPDLNKTVTSNALGFFRFEMIPTGTYEIIYRTNEDYEGRDNVTVAAGATTLRTLGNLKAAERASESRPRTVESKSSSPERTSQPTTEKKSTASINQSSGYGKIRLESNVDGAKFVVDGKTFGAGNNTYSRIKSGQHKVEVSKPGYTDHTEIVTVSANKTLTLKANLSRKAASKDESLTANDYYELGNDAFLKENHQTAIDDYTKAIELSPNHIDAYTKRAQVFAAIGRNEKAAADYIRIGEIYNFKNQHDLAIGQFTSALKYIPENKTALSDRGGAKMDKGEYRSALGDYMRALEIDDEFYPARFGAGIAEFKLGNHKSAEKQFKKARDINDSDPYLYHYLMLTYLARDNIKEMKKTYSQFKNIAGPEELAEFRTSSRFEPIIRLIGEDDL